MDAEQKVTPLELFSDLVFVPALAERTLHALAAHVRHPQEAPA